MEGSSLPSFHDDLIPINRMGQLYRIMNQKDAEIRHLKEENEELTKLVADLIETQERDKAIIKSLEMKFKAQVAQDNGGNAIPESEGKMETIQSS
ncbi:hypothetical protein B9Z19DRAFT_1135093 [Tuber borchii]|uniref:Uncharacterized protein n=1 Tax=Tuber borchii TaxID=42251 RepID=A0A2T6ZDB3_TUBBO|nr:hypothetical protein B9Z19DRAFT_1135093 [Tuber borchii]